MGISKADVGRMKRQEKWVGKGGNARKRVGKGIKEATVPFTSRNKSILCLTPREAGSINRGN